MMKKRLIISIIICILILTALTGIWLYRKSIITDADKEIDGRFDFYIYTIAPNNTLIPYALSLHDQAILDQPPRIYFESLINAYLYLLLFSADDRIAVLFPNIDGNFPREYRFTRYFLPKDNNWKPYLGYPGQYNIYLIVSTARLKRVEKLLSRYAECCRTGQPDNAQKEIISLLKAEIVKYKQEREWIKNTEEIPEWIGGTVRSGEDEVIYRAWSIPFRGIIAHSVPFYYTAGENNE